MPFPADFTHGTVALLEGQESLQGCSHLITSLLALSPRVHGLSRVCPQSERLLWQNALESQLLCMLLIMVALGALMAGHGWPSQWDDPAGNLDWVLSQLHCSGGSLSSDRLQVLEPKVPTRHLHSLSFNTRHPPCCVWVTFPCCCCPLCHGWHLCCS